MNESEKTFCLKHYRQTFPDKGCDICELEARVKELEGDLEIMRLQLKAKRWTNGDTK